MSPTRRRARLTRRTMVVLVCLASCSAAVSATAANAAVYWGSNGTIAAAGLDGAGANSNYFKPPFPSDSAGPVCGVAVSRSYLYWVGAFGIGRVNLEGSAVPTTIVPSLQQPCGVAIDEAHVYWADPKTGSLGRANLDGSEANTALVAGLGQPCGVAVDRAHVYWMDWPGIGRARLDGSEPEPGFLPMAATACGLALDDHHLYWGNHGSIGRARLDGSEPDPTFIAGIGGVGGIAVDATHIFWTDQPEGMAYSSIGRADIGGTGANRSWLPSEQFSLGGVAVDGRASPPSLPLPSRPIRFGQVRHALRTGATVIDVWVPERGELTVLTPKLGWKVLKGTAPPPWRGGTFRWRLKLWPGRGRVGDRIRTQLRNRGWAPVALRVAYNEEGQLPLTAVKRITLRKRR